MSDATRELRRRITYLMLYRVVMITLVLGITVALNLASPQELAAPGSISLFFVIGVTYLLTLVYAGILPRVPNVLRFADAQLFGDLLITTVLVHVTGGAQSGYTFFYPLSIVGAATVRYRGGAVVVALASVVMFVAVSLLGWLRVLPVPSGTRLVPWDLGGMTLVRQIVLNVGACAAIGILAANLGAQLARSGEVLARQLARTADLTVLKEDIIRCLSSGLVTIDAADRVMTMNEAAAEILEHGVDEAVGQKITTVLPEMRPLLTGLGPRAQVKRGEITVMRGTGTARFLGVSLSPLTNHKDEPVGRIVNFQDLTELRRMESTVKQAERLAVVGGIAAGVAHEIRNPLASISGCIELLKAGAPQASAEDQRLFDIVLREVERLNKLLGDLLDYARPHERVTMDLEPGAMLEETARVFAQDRAHPGVQVAVREEQPAEVWVVEGDSAQLRQVMWNILRNAAEAMPEGGAITVTLRWPRVDGTTWAEITFADTGVGIPPEDVDRIFEPFYTTKHRGHGLGLATVHRIVTEHGGSITVSSTVGQGTRMTVLLPARKR